MPTVVGKPGFEMSQDERIAALVTMVGGPTKAASLIGRTRTHIDNMRKPGAPLRLEDLLPLAVAAGVSLDWVASGYQVRPDINSEAAATPPGAGDDSLVRLPSLRAGHEPAPLAVSSGWLEQTGLPVEAARYAVISESGMAPLLVVGSTVILDVRSDQKRRSGIYLVEAGEELLPRRLNPLPGGEFELVADNSTWRYHLGADADPEMYRIVWAATRM